MNDFDPSNMSRSAKNKNKKVEPKFARKSEKKTSEHKILRIGLIILAFVILASVPVYGSWANRKEPQKQAETSVSRKVSSTTEKKATTSSESESESEAPSTSEIVSSSVEPSSEVSSTPSSSSETVSSSITADTASSAVGQTAVLGASQTLYNFAVSHGMTTEQVVALNPGVTVGNYTQYSGRNLNIQ
ncbi:peptidoglycan-binding protein LysM [uncultured Leuconostoc sp.]|uniref:peptidoglycan-binding protein LysM n=1 Tax=uncultured Leuconostoc sp. TaxID=173262 RepID=UPI0025F21A7C|nr:peptidoglycan-binding protein LysM [uncultured Leuconostoc sp.]